MAIFEWFIRCCFAYIHLVPLTLIKFRCLFLLSSNWFQVYHIYYLAILVFIFILFLTFLIEIKYIILYFLSVIPHSNSFFILKDYFAFTMLQSLMPAANIYFPVFPLVLTFTMKFVIFKHSFINFTFFPY